ncbi:MAG: TerC/Alx family metal homeostasis membrane protein [Acidimicrobiales bacterium]|nr:TerC/Alx family metal homeostasis membrane protein [Acidimicrobiales bacterium]
MAATSPSAVLGAESSRDNFVDLDVGAQWWIALAVVVVALLAIDLYRHRDNNEPTTRGAALESAGWVACGLAFGVVVLVGFGGDAFGEYISGYLIEKSLSVDNVFVWSILFSSMAVPLRYQHRVLFWGIFGALTLRLVFIVIGSALIERFSVVLVGFGVFLVFTGLRVIRHRDDEGEDSSAAGLGLLGRVIPVSDEYDGHKFLTMRDGVRMATPLLAALVVVEATDVVFAVDSVPAVLAVSNEPYLIFASNAFAILGLRAMYFLLADARQRFHYLSHALGGVLVFVGIKMAASEWYHLDTYVSLSVILLILVAAIILSERRTRLEAAN